MIEHEISRIDRNLVLVFRGLDLFDQTNDRISEKLLISEGEYKSSVYKLLRAGFLKEIITDQDKVNFRPKFRGSLRQIASKNDEEMNLLLTNVILGQED